MQGLAWTINPVKRRSRKIGECAAIVTGRVVADSDIGRGDVTADSNSSKAVLKLCQNAKSSIQNGLCFERKQVPRVDVRPCKT